MAQPTAIGHEAPAAHSGNGKAVSAPCHPLDPLSTAEIEEALRILIQEKQLGADVRFVSVFLNEPVKRAVEQYRAGSPFDRAALVLLLDRNTQAGYEVVVDLVHKSVASFDRLPAGVQPPIMLDEFAEVEQAVKRSPEFLAALAKRGVTNADLVMVEPWSAGMYGTEVTEDRGRRRMRALCFVRSEALDNGYARPLDSMVVVVDLNKMAILRIEDYATAPLPPESGNWAREYIPNVRKDLKPIDIVQPEGPSFKVEGYQVEWQKWKFRVGFTAREGLVLNTITYNDDGRERPVLYRASISEMVVPYGDPGEQYYRKNAFDIGEYGIGMLANSLALGCDCLGVIHYFDFPLIDSLGRVTELKHAVCLHEEDVGILWKHTDWRTGQSEVRRSRRLSVSFIATVGNYEYGFYWYFYQDGSIQCEIKLTGIMNTTTLAPGEKPEYGVEIAPRLNAPFHQHIFAARLVASVDGPNNSVYEVNSASMPAGPGNPYGNAFKAEETLLGTEKQAQRRVNASSARFWRIVNPSRKNRLGQPVGYRLMPGENCPPLVQPDAAVMRRAGFTANHLWVTPYQPRERYAAGDYPNQHPTGDGLSRWTSADRNVEDTELVVWYVFAANHVPRPEDWPVMPVASIGFHLKPDGFFERSPAMDVPPTSKACAHAQHH
jgi:primary-amine oxidase